LKNDLEGMNIKFHVIKAAIVWSQYLYASLYGELPLWILGWLADFPDCHNFANPFYASSGDFGGSQGYNNPAIDALIVQGATETNPAIRQTIYHDIEELVLSDVPSVATIQGLGRHFEREWINGWYFNVVAPGNPWMSMWKQWYVPECLYPGETVPNTPPEGFMPFDVTYSGLVDMDDIGFAALAYGSASGPPITGPWNFRCDVFMDRQIDMTDIGYIALYFGRTC